MADLKFIGVNIGTVNVQRQASQTADALLINSIRPSGSTTGPLVINPSTAVTGTNLVLNVQDGSANSRLQVTGAGQLASTALLTAPSYSFIGDLGTGVGNPSAGVLSLAADGADRLEVSSTGITSTVDLTIGGGAVRSLIFNDTTTDYELIATGEVLFVDIGGVRVGQFQAPGGVTPQFLVPFGDAAAPPYAFITGGNSGMYYTGAGPGFAAGGVLKLSVEGAAVTSTVPILAPAGGAGAPSLSFSTAATSGFFAVGANVGVSVSGSERWRFEANLLELRQSSMTITQGVSGGALAIQGWRTTAAGAGVTLSNRASFTAPTGSAVIQNTVRIHSVIDHTGAATVGRGHAGLEIDSTNTSLDTSGTYYIADFKSGGTRVAAIRNGSTAATQGNFLAGDGAAATPSLSFLGAPNLGFYRSGNTMIATFLGSPRYSFSNVGISTTASNSNFTIGHTGVTSRVTITGRMDGLTAASASPSITLTQHASLPFVGDDIAQTMVAIQSIVNQAGGVGNTSSFTALDISTTETALGSGGQYLINAKAGAAGTTQMFAVTNTGRVLTGDGSATEPSKVFVAAPTTGIFRGTAPAELVGVSIAGVETLWIANGFVLPPTGKAVDLGASSNKFRDFYGARARLDVGAAGTPAVTFHGFTDAGLFHDGVESVVASSEGIEVFRWKAPGGVAPQMLLQDGDATAPGYSFVSAPANGFFTSAVNNIGVSIGGTERWRFANGILYAMASNPVITTNTPDDALTIQSSIATGSAEPGLIFTNSGNFTGTGAQIAASIRSTVAQNAGAGGGFTALDIAVTETSKGLGSHYLIDAKAGAAGTTRMFAVTNLGRVRAAEGSQASPSLSFLSSPGTGFYNDTDVEDDITAVSGNFKIATFSEAWGTFRPGTDAGTSLGVDSYRWSNLYAQETNVYTTTSGGAARTFTAYCQVIANATPVTAATIIIPTTKAVAVRVTGVGRYADATVCGAVKKFAVVRNVGGVLTVTQDGTTDSALDATATTNKWDVIFATSGASLLVRAQKDGGSNVDWAMTIETQTM